MKILSVEDAEILKIDHPDEEIVSRWPECRRPIPGIRWDPRFETAAARLRKIPVEGRRTPRRPGAE